MKFALVLAVTVLALASVSDASVRSNVKAAGDDMTITKVVKMLQTMLEDSQHDQEGLRILYAKQKCFCDTNEDKCKATIKDAEEQIGLLEAEVQELLASVGKLSTEVWQLTQDRDENDRTRTQLESDRTKEHKEYKSAVADLQAAIAQMDEAIDTLAAVGADQTLSDAGGKKMSSMRGTSLVKVDSKVQQALLTASSLMTDEQKAPVASFLQAPFQGDYRAQSGQVVGILKNMKRTFESNMEEATSSEKAAKETFDELIYSKNQAFDEMGKSLDKKKEQLANDSTTVADKKQQLQTVKETLAEEQAFLADLLPTCERKSKEYYDKKMLMSNEDVAIAEAISILNSDHANDMFATVSATSTGAAGPEFLQLKEVQAHKAGTPEHASRTAQEILKRANGHQSTRLSKIISMLEENKENPFDTCLVEIEKMVKVIDDEHEEDMEQNSWCKAETSQNTDSKNQKQSEIEGVKGEIQDLNQKINDPEDGLRAVVKSAEDSLIDNRKARTDATNQRNADHAAYEKDCKNLDGSKVLLEKATNVLKKYYQENGLMDYDDFLQIKQTPGKTDRETNIAWRDQTPERFRGTTMDEYKEGDGQSEAGKKIIEMLQFIAHETEVERVKADQDEHEAEIEFKKQISDMEDEAEQIEDRLTDTQQTLAETVSQHDDKMLELKLKEKQKLTIEQYLKSIKPGCDFIFTNLSTREEHRKTEKEALMHAQKSLKETPAYLASQLAIGGRDEHAHQAAYHDKIGQYLD